MARQGNPISVRLDQNRSSDSSWFSDYYYGKLVYQDVNLRSYFGSIRPPTRLTSGFRLGRFIIIHFPKRTFIHLFFPRRFFPKRRKKARPGKKKGRRAGKRVESTKRAKKNERRFWPIKKKRYGYHARSPSIKKNLYKSLRVSGTFKHPKYAGILNDDFFKKTSERDVSWKKHTHNWKKHKHKNNAGPTRHKIKMKNNRILVQRADKVIPVHMKNSRILVHMALLLFFFFLIALLILIILYVYASSSFSIDWLAAVFNRIWYSMCRHTFVSFLIHMGLPKSLAPLLVLLIGAETKFWNLEKMMDSSGSARSWDPLGLVVGNEGGGGMLGSTGTPGGSLVSMEDDDWAYFQTVMADEPNRGNDQEVTQPNPDLPNAADVGAGQLKMQSTVEKHLRRHCNKSQVRERYPQLDPGEIDYLDWAKKFMISELDTDKKSDNDKLHLARGIQYTEIRSLLDNFLERLYNPD